MVGEGKCDYLALMTMWCGGKGKEGLFEQVCSRSSIKFFGAVGASNCCWQIIHAHVEPRSSIWKKVMSSLHTFIDYILVYADVGVRE